MPFQPDPVLYPASFLLFKSLPFVILAVLAFNMVQRFLWKGWGKKRSASFSCALLFTALLAAAFFIMRYTLNDLLLIPVVLGIVLFIIIKRKVLFPFKFKCIRCGGMLSIKEIIALDSNLCRHCEKEENNDDSTSVYS